MSLTRTPDGVNPLLRTHALGGAHAAGLRSCRAAVMPPDAAPLSFRGSCKPLALARGFMTLLVYLARNANRVLTREQLSLHIWPEGTEAASNVLDTYIHHLRDKLEEPGAQLIQTVRGVGYALRAPTAGAPSSGSGGGPTGGRP